MRCTPASAHASESYEEGQVPSTTGTCCGLLLADSSFFCMVSLRLGLHADADATTGAKGTHGFCTHRAAFSRKLRSCVSASSSSTCSCHLALSAATVGRVNANTVSAPPVPPRRVTLSMTRVVAVRASSHPHPRVAHLRRPAQPQLRRPPGFATSTPASSGLAAAQAPHPPASHTHPTVGQSDAVVELGLVGRLCVAGGMGTHALSQLTAGASLSHLHHDGIPPQRLEADEHADCAQPPHALLCSRRYCNGGVRSQRFAMPSRRRRSE